MSNEKDFIIENGVLTEYTGNGGAVVIPDGVTEIGTHAFYRSDISSVTIPESVIKIGEDAFGRCSKIKSIALSDNLKEIDGFAFEDCRGLTEVVIPKSVKKIGGNAFSSCKGLISVIISEGATEIGGGAFRSCENLVSVSIPKGVTELGNYAFSNCGKIKEITLPNSIKRIGEGAFEGCAELSSINIPDGTEEIGGTAFADCVAIADIKIPASVSKVGPSVFSGCTGLKNLEVSGKIECVTTIMYEYKDKEVRYPKDYDLFRGYVPVKENAAEYYDLDNIEKYYFAGIPLAELRSECKMIYSIFYLTCPSLHDDDEKKLYEAYIKSQRKKIIGFIIELGNAALLSEIFSRGLITAKDEDDYIEIANKRNNIEIKAMLMDYKFKTFSADKLEKEEERKMEKAISKDTMSPYELRKIWATKSLADGTLSIVSYKGSDTEITVPDRIGDKKVSCFGNWVFSPYQGSAKNTDVRKEITSVIIPEGITGISDHAFEGCGKLKTVIVPKSVTLIGYYAFAGCDSLTDITLSENLKSVASRAFKDITIHAPSGSKAEEYCKWHEKSDNIKFIPTEEN